MGDTMTLLLKAAAEMRAEDQNGWPVVCDIAVETLASHEARIAELEGALRGLLEECPDRLGCGIHCEAEISRSAEESYADALKVARRALHTEGE